MNELDLLKQFRADIAEPSTEAWQRARAAIAAAHTDVASATSRAGRIRSAAIGSPRRSLAALAGTAAAASVAALVLTASATPSIAQAFPILSEGATDISGTGMIASLHAWLPQAVAAAAATQAHAFSVPDGTGYVLASPDGSTLCIIATPAEGVDAGGVTSSGRCAPTAYAEQSGLAMGFGFGSGELDYAALVPTGGSVEITESGTTTAVPLSDGIASGRVDGPATLTLQLGNETQTIPLDSGAGPAGPASAPPSSAPAGASGQSTAPAQTP
jgi:hypothetical protein